MKSNQTPHVNLEAFSAHLASMLTMAAQSVVRIDDGSRLTATGVVWSGDGFIVTTSHGTERDDDLAVVLPDGERIGARLIGRDDESDLALLRVDHAGLSPLPIADESVVAVGQIVLAIGRPGNLGMQATFGIIGAKHDIQSMGKAECIVSTDAALYPGFSGGPLVNIAGEIVGINNRSFGNGQSIALGSSLIAHVVEAIQARGKSGRGYLGVSSQAVMLPEGMRARLAIPQRVGLLVVGLADDGPADAAGMILGDTILALGDRPLDDVDDLRTALRSLPSWTDIELKIIRGGEIKNVTAKLGQADVGHESHYARRGR